MNNDTPFTDDEVRRMAIALWEIRMAAETASVDDPPWALPNEIAHRVAGALGRHRAWAQQESGRDKAAR